MARPSGRGAGWRDAPAHRVHLVIGELERFVAIQLIAGFTRLAIECAQNTLTTTNQLQVALVGQDDGLGSPVRPMTTGSGSAPAR